VAPDLCIEIISTYESRSYIERRLDEYFESGAQLVWHIYPESQQISVFSSPDECVVYDAEHELTASGLFPDFRCQVKDIFDLG
jgi:Uma2 family endonuclease